MNASYFIMLVPDIRGRCWWYDNSGWTFPPVFCYILLLCDRWQHRGNLKKIVSNMQVCMKRRCITEFLHADMTHWHSLMLAEHLWRSNSGYQCSEVVGDIFQQQQHDCHIPDGRGMAVTPWNVKDLHQLTCTNQCMMTRELCPKLNTSFSALEIMVTCSLNLL